MSTLYLHIGHGKTGSSWIQACLRLNREALASQGIVYARGDDAFVTESLQITSGNAVTLFQSKASFSQSLADNPVAKDQSLLYSSENIIQLFLESNGEDYLEEIASKYGFENIEILLFIRNPISLAVSFWQQRTKRRGNHQVMLSNLHEHPEIGWDIVFYADDLLHRLKKCTHVVLTIRNFSYCSGNLMDEVAGWLKVPEHTLGLLPPARINRSLTMSELIFQTSLNKVLGRSGGLLSDPLCEKLPDIVSEKILPSLQVQEALWLQLQETINRLNEQIPAEHQYQCDIQHPEPLPGEFTFTRQQIEIIAESLGNEILTLRTKLENTNESSENLKTEIAALQSGLENNAVIHDKPSFVFQMVKGLKKRLSEALKRIHG